MGGLAIYRNGVDILGGATIGFSAGSIDVNSGNQNGSQNVPGLADGAPVTPILISNDGLGEPGVSISGTTVTWTQRAGFSGIWVGTILLVVVGG